ncbi:hypothetical protein ACFYOK_37615 [Microbispora bryophytorum]|uniref:hypothetical protein n=1 Tax=Microbispora bryophytorum TaxID=1460882 RepID=UPI0033F2BB5C
MTTTVPEPGDTAQASDPREGCIEGLEALAQLLRENPELPLPYDGMDGQPISFFVDGPSSQEQALAFVEVMQEPRLELKPSVYHGLHVFGRVGGIKVKLHIDPAQVCEKTTSGRYASPDDQVLSEVTEWRIPAALLDAVGQTEGEVPRG